MLNIEIYNCKEVEKIAHIVHRDGFAAVSGLLTQKQFEIIERGANRIIKEQMDAIKLEDANRGFARYSFGNQLMHAEWAMLVDLPGLLPIIDKIWNSQDYYCGGAGGDYSVPGAKIQPLHSDIGEFIHDPSAQVSSRDLPPALIVTNFLMVDFTEANGAIRFVPGTQRSRQPIPSLEDESEWMKKSIVCAPAGTAIVRDVRCWHGGTANTSNQIRPITSVGYYAPWFRSRDQNAVPMSIYKELSPRGQKLCSEMVERGSRSDNERNELMANR